MTKANSPLHHRYFTNSKSAEPTSNRTSSNPREASGSIAFDPKHNLDHLLHEPQTLRDLGRSLQGVNLNAFYGDLERLNLLKKMRGKYRVTSLARDRQVSEQYDRSTRTHRLLVLPAGKLMVMQLWLAGLLTLKAEVRGQQ